MQTTGKAEIAASYVMTPDSIAAFLQHENDRGGSAVALRNSRRVVTTLFDWLPEDKTLSKDLLLTWRQSLKDRGYTSQTEQNYIKGINRYLDYMGFSDIRFNRGRPRDISGKQFGYLTAM